MNVMKGKIDLKYPYSEDFVAGYVYKNKEPRRTLSLIREDGSRTSTAYARYLMAVDKGEYLEDSVCVDHVDGNQLHDDISNLQCLRYSDHTKKTNTQKGKSESRVILSCAGCGVEIDMPVRQSFLVKKTKNSFCSRSCSGKYGTKREKGSTTIIKFYEKSYI